MNKNNCNYSQQDIIRWLHETDSAALEQLFYAADHVRREQVGEAVHLRGLVEISNHCARACAYCGLNCHNKNVQRINSVSQEAL